MKKYMLAVCVLALLLAGCTSRSISDSGYRNPYGWGRQGNPLYSGELTEFDILGIAPAGDATEANIAKALETARPPELRRGDKLILIQSGAPVPDNAMIEDASRYFAVAPFSGIPPAEKGGIAESLRLRAAQGGYRYVLCYWGVLESAQLDKEGNALSWVPIAGFFVPDQKQQMRIRLKGLLLDVATGGWRMVTPEAYSESRFSSGWSREANDQKLVEELKATGYRRLVANFVNG